MVQSMGSQRVIQDLQANSNTRHNLAVGGGGGHRAKDE